jgi:hypothetical protein
MLDTLKAEVELELALAYADRQQTKRLGSLLVGAMLEDAAGGPARARLYDAAWVNEVTGLAIRSDRPFDTDVVRASDLAAAAASQRLSPPFDADRYVERGGLARALEQFAAAPETVFVLTGGSGTGKTWGSAAWATRRLAGRVRVVLRGSDITASVTLQRLVADAVAPYSDRVWRDEQVLARLVSVSQEPGKGPLVVVVEDLRPDELGARGESRVLTRLVESLRDVGGKLILSCEEQLWKLHRPWRYLPEGTLFDPSRTITEEPTNRSYTLPVLTPDELVEVVRRRLPAGPAGRTPAPERLLVAPGYLPLRNPSLLTRYLDLYGRQLLEEDTSPGPVNVERLLAESVAAQLERSAGMVGADDVTLRQAFNGLIACLWERRRSSAGHAEAVEVLEQQLPHQGPQALVALRRFGLLAAEIPVRLLDGTVADHLYARRLEQRLSVAPEELAGLDPERDATTVEALIRGSPRFTDWAEALRRRDTRWRSPIARGLAQREPTLAAYGLAAALTRPTGNVLVDRDGCLAFGTLAARDQAIFERVAAMYLGTDEADAIRGAEALAFAMDYVPDRVCGLVRARWEREYGRTTPSERRSAGRRLSHTLLPLYRINHREPAAAARSTLDDLTRTGFSSFLRQPSWPQSRRAGPSRGPRLPRRRPPFPSSATRHGSIPIPCSDYSPAGSTGLNPGRGPISRTSSPSPGGGAPSAGPTRGRSSRRSVNRTSLAGHPAFRVFAERGASVACLRRLCVGAVSAESTMVSMTRDVRGFLPYYFTNTGNLFLLHAEQITRHPDVRQFVASLLRVVQTGHGLLPLPWHEALESAQHIATRNALDELIGIARRQDDPLTWIRDLPRDWEALYAARRLLQAGIRSEAVLAFATAGCVERAQGGSVTAIHERELCLGEIALASGNPGAAVAARFTDQTPSLFGSASEARAHGITAHIDAHPEEIFTHLESAVADIEAVVSLFHWRRLAREWRSLLAAEVFCRMFDRRPIEHDEAGQLVEQMREVIRTLPPSPTSDEYDRVYGAVASWLSGTPVTLTLDPRPDSAIRRCHGLAARLLERAQTAHASGEGAGWIDDFLCQRDCWWESTRYEIKDGTISAGLGEGLYLIFMLPALRLALAAVGHHLGRPDPAGQCMRDRYDALQRAVAARRKVDGNKDVAGREAAPQELEGADPSRIRDERVLGTSGFILLLLGRYAETEERLRRALASPLIDQQHRAGALYNLACVLARTDREEDCRTSLEEAVCLGPWLRPGLLQDEDLLSVRGQGWFQSLAPQPPPAATGPAPEPPPAAPAQAPLVSVEPGEPPDRFEGWELRYRIHEPYDRACPAWARSMVAALTVQFPGATTTVTPVAEYADSVVVSAPQGVQEPQLRRAQAVTNLVRTEVARRAVLDS